MVLPAQASSESAEAFPVPSASADVPENAVSSAEEARYSVSPAHVVAASAAASVASMAGGVNGDVHVSFYVVVLWSSCHLC